MDLYEACENGNEERVVEVLVYGERWHWHGLHRHNHHERRGSNASASRRSSAPSADALAASLATHATQLLLAVAARDVLRARGTAGRTPLLAACMGAQLGVARLLLGESCLVYFTSRRADEVETLLQPLRDEYTAFTRATGGSGGGDNQDAYFEVTLAEKHDSTVGGARVPAAAVRFPPARTVAAQDLLDGATHVDDFGNTPLQCVACFGCGTSEAHVDDGLALARLLLRHGDQPNLPKLVNQWTPLHWAAYHGNHEMCAILLDPAAALTSITASTASTSAPPLGKTQSAIPLLVNDDNLFAADVAGRRGLALAVEMRELRARPTDDQDDDEYARWRLRLDHVATLRLFVREFLASATSLVRYVSEMNARLPRQLRGDAEAADAATRKSVHWRDQRRRRRRRRPFTCADAIRYGQHLLYWMGCFGLEDEVRALLELPLELAAAVADAGHTVVHLRPLYVCSCEADKRQSVLHAVAVHGQRGIVRLLLEQMLYEQQHPLSAARVRPPVATSAPAKTERQRTAKKTSKASMSAAVAPGVIEPPTATPDADAAATATATASATLLDVLPLADAGWRNYRNESPLFLAVLFLRDEVVSVFCESLSAQSLAWELANCNVEGSYIHHVASAVTRRTLLGIREPSGRLTAAEYVLLFDGLSPHQRAFKESLIEAMREESVSAPSLRVTPAGSTRTSSALGGLVRAAATDYVLVGASDAVLVRHAQALQLKIKHRGSTLRSKYSAAAAHVFEPFRSLQRQQVVLDIIRKNVDLQRHVAQRNLRAIFPLHDQSGCQNIMRHWVRAEDAQRVFQPFAGDSLTQFLLESRAHQYEMLWPLLTYFGEKHAFYYAFLLFYSVWLVVLAVPGALCQAAWSLGHARYAAPLFAVFTSLWATLFVERWKRKRSEIQSTFGNFKRNRSERAPAFYGDFLVEAPERGVVDTTFPRALQLARVYAGLPLLLTMAALAVAIFVGVKLNAASSAVLHRAFPWMPPTLAAYVIPVLNAVSMLVLDNVYTQVALRLTQWENHRTVWQFESMLATKLFWFKFLNAFLSLFWVAFVERDAPALRKQLVIIMGARQIWYMVQRSILPLLTVARAWQRAGFRLGTISSTSTSTSTWTGETVSPGSPAPSPPPPPRQKSWFSLTHEWYYAEPPPPPPSADPADADNTPPPPIVLLQELMQPSDFLMGKQMEVVLHFGYITMFVSVLPAAPLLALGSVVVSTRLDVACATQAKRRPPFESETEVSTFMSILEFMSFAAVAVNCAVLFFTTMDDFDSLLAATTALGAAPDGSESDDVESDAKRYVGKLWVLLVLEHVVLGLKALLSLTIDDAAAWVQNDEDRADDEASQQAAQLERVRRFSLSPGSLGKTPCDGDSATPQPSAVSTLQTAGDAATPTLRKLAADKLELAVRERDAALERERALHREVSELQRHLETAKDQKAEADARRVLSPRSAAATPRLVSPAVAATASGQRACWICVVLHETTCDAQRRCLTCRAFFCGECDELVHLDDLGVREPKHFRVSAVALKPSDSDKAKSDGRATTSTTAAKSRERELSEGNASHVELHALLTGYYLATEETEPSESALAAVLVRCQGGEALVARFLRNAQRRRAFRSAAPASSPPQPAELETQRE